MASTRTYAVVDSASETLGMCIECEDQPSEVFCEQCLDDYCAVCFSSLHRTGHRAVHTTKPIERRAAREGSVAMELGDTPAVGAAAGADAGGAAPMEIAEGAAGIDVLRPRREASGNGDYFIERARHVPLRLSERERGLLQLLEAALETSDYTDRVDIITYRSKLNTMLEAYRETLYCLEGMVLAQDLKTGSAMLKTSIEDNAEFFQTAFEIGRRFKILNPEKMRTEYGKLVHILMDAQLADFERVMKFTAVVPIQTVHSFLEAKGRLDILTDPRITDATMAISQADRTRDEVAALSVDKSAAIAGVCAELATPDLLAADIERVLLSLGDNHAFLLATRDACDQAMRCLETYFSPDEPEQGFSLAVQSGLDGARHTHSHATQYTYAQQTFALWRAIQYDFFKLWHLAEQDLLDPNNDYRLRDTGQGLNRMQGAPRVAREMGGIIGRVQRNMGTAWVGSSVVHLGDHNVPSGLVFVDKYTQVPRILNPVLTTVRMLSVVAAKDAGVARYIDEVFQGVENARRTILCDFFRHGFDSSGATNSFDAGTCIDGRLTSAWNWCSKIEKKPYFPLFLLTGFIGFDGQF